VSDEVTFPADLRAFVDAQQWTFAKTMPEWPHYYIVRDRVDEALFERLVVHIRARGREGRFYERTLIYYEDEESGLVYWTMGAPLGETTIVNRCRREETYERRAAEGRLPSRIGFVRAGRRTAGVAEAAARVTLPVETCDPRDLRGLVEVVSGAFRDDPTWSWAFPDPDLRERWWRFCIESALRYPWTFRTGGNEAVSVWIPPEGTEFSPQDEERLPDVLAELTVGRTKAVQELLERFEAAHPRGEPHYYLSLLGTGIAHRGRGIGMGLLEENLARIDKDRMPAYLESSNPANDRRYEAAGFAPVVTFRAPGDGPLVTGMWRARR